LAKLLATFLAAVLAAVAVEVVGQVRGLVGGLQEVQLKLPQNLRMKKKLKGSVNKERL